MKLRIGIDIGSKGAIAYFIDDKLVSYDAIPLTEGRPDLKQFVEGVMSYRTLDGITSVHAVIEDLHSIYGTGAASNFQFGWINGATEAILTTLSVPYTKVSPKKWQKEMWEGIRPVQIPVKEKNMPVVEQPKTMLYEDTDLETGEKVMRSMPVPEIKKIVKYKVDTKATSLLAAKRLFPDETFLATQRSKVPHDGIVDAVLIGLYCVRKF